MLGHMCPCGRLQCSEVAGSLPETIIQADVTSLLNTIIRGDYFMSDSKLARPEHMSRLPHPHLLWQRAIFLNDSALAPTQETVELI